MVLLEYGIMAITLLFDRGNKCSIHFTPTKWCFKHFGDAFPCEGKENGSIPLLHPISFCRLTDKPIRYERIIRGSNPLEKTMPN